MTIFIKRGKAFRKISGKLIFHSKLFRLYHRYHPHRFLYFLLFISVQISLYFALGQFLSQIKVDKLFLSSIFLALHLSLPIFPSFVQLVTLNPFPLLLNLPFFILYSCLFHSSLFFLIFLSSLLP